MAVLPFAVWAADPGRSSSPSGIAEDIVAALSRYPSLFVDRALLVLHVRGRSVDVKQVGRPSCDRHWIVVEPATDAQVAILGEAVTRTKSGGAPSCHSPTPVRIGSVR